MAFLTAEDLRASFSLFCCVYGIGTLGMPGNFARAGILYASIALILMAFSNVYATCVLSKCLLIVPKNVKTFGDLGEHCFGKAGRYITVTSQMGVCIMVPMVFLVLGSSLLTVLFPDSLGKDFWIVLMAISILPIALTPSLKESAGAALAGCLGTILADFISLGILYYYMSGHNQAIIPPDFSLEEIISCFGNLSLAYGAAVVIPAIQREHSDPSHMPRIVFFTLFVITILFVVIALTGYLLVGCQIPGNLLFAVSGTVLGFTANRGAIVLAFLAMQLHITIAFSFLVFPALYLGERQFLGLHKQNDDHLEIKEDKEYPPYTKSANRGSSYALESANNVSFIRSNIPSMADTIHDHQEEEEIAFTKAEALKSTLFRLAVISIMVVISCVLKDHFHALADFVGASSMSVSCIILPILFYLKLFWPTIPIYEKVISIIAVIICSCLAIYLSIHFAKELFSHSTPPNFPFCPVEYQEVVFTNTSYYS